MYILLLLISHHSRFIVYEYLSGYLVSGIVFAILIQGDSRNVHAWNNVWITRLMKKVV